MVHQFQVRHNEIGSIQRAVPYYQAKYLLSDLEFKNKKYELNYPVDFLCQMNRTILINICEFYEQMNVNPFPAYYSGDCLISKKNKSKKNSQLTNGERDPAVIS